MGIKIDTMDIYSKIWKPTHLSSSSSRRRTCYDQWSEAQQEGCNASKHKTLFGDCSWKLCSLSLSSNSLCNLANFLCAYAKCRGSRRYQNLSWKLPIHLWSNVCLNIAKGTTDPSINFFKLNQLLKSKQGVYLGSTKQLEGDFATHKERLLYFRSSAWL